MAEVRIRWQSVAALGVFTISALLGVLWIVFVRAPSPTEICQHKISLTKKIAVVGAPDADPNSNANPNANPDQGAAAEALIERLQSVCVKNAERKIRLRGKIQYAGHARCVIQSQSLEDAERC